MHKTVEDWERWYADPAPWSVPGNIEKLIQDLRELSVLAKAAESLALWGLRVEVVEITQDIATAWLELNITNRTLKPGTVAKLMRSLTSGKWDDLNGETIIFSDKGDLLDGQHRLEVVKRSGVSIISLVVYGVQATKRGTIDTGNSRMLQDFFSMHNHPSAGTLAAALTLMKMWDDGHILHSQKQAPFASFDQAREYYEQCPGFDDSVRRARVLKHFMPPSQLAVLDYKFRLRDATLADIWYATMHNGVQYPSGAAFFALRERLIREMKQDIKRHRLEHFVYTLKAWNAARKGENIRVFKWAQDEDVPVML